MLTTFDPTNPTSGKFVAAFPITQCGTLHIKNASPVDVKFAVENSSTMTYVVQAGEPRDIPVPMPRATVYWSQQGKLNTNTKQIQSVVYVESYEKGQAIPASQALARHTNPTNIGFSATFGIGSTLTVGQDLNIFNPTNSGVNIIFYSARCLTNSTGVPAYNIYYFTGADNNLPIAVPAFNHIIGGPTSIAHCTAQDGNAGSVVGPIETINLAQNVIGEILPFPDQVLIPPGSQIMLDLSDGTTGHVVRMSAKWTETAI